MISIAGQVLSAPTPDILAWAGAHLPQESAWAFVNRAFPGYGLSSVTLPTGYRPLPRPKLNSFYWPSGAARWAMGLFLVHGGELAAIHDAAFGPTGAQRNRVVLRMQTEDRNGAAAEQLQAGVYVLPPVPLCRLVSGGVPDNPAYLVTVVDQRYFWWFKPTPDFGINDTAGVSWADVYTQIASALGVTIGHDTIRGEYLQPSRGINLTHEAIPPVFDAVAYNLGQRVVCSYDGSVFTQNFSTASQRRAADRQNHPQRVYVAGGERFLEQL